jgi:XapX domain-containing protein
MKIFLGLLLALGIGGLCRLAGVPLPAPPLLIGAMLVVAMSTGYVATDKLARHREAKNRAYCGGPVGGSRTPHRSLR